jgi:tetratricopeptide (TPR) repeat protein
MAPVALDQRHAAQSLKASLPMRFALPAAVFCLTIAAFLPALENGFVNWDDDLNFLDNRSYRGLGWAQLRWMLTTFHGSNYRPVTWITSGLDFVIWEMEAFGYHLTSLLFHGANAVLVYFLAGRLFASFGFGTANEAGLIVASLFSALLFSVHPLRVEVVAWASARNDIVAGFFSLWTVLVYLKYAMLPQGDSKRRVWLATALSIYTLSLLSKGTGMTLPLVLLVLDVYPLKRLGSNGEGWFDPRVRSLWLEKLPFLALALGAAVLALLAKQSTGATTPWEGFGLTSRLVQMFYGLTFYLVKTIVPLGLSPLYQLTDRFDPSNAMFLFYALASLAITVSLLLARRKWPAGLASWVAYSVMLLPLSGIVQAGPQIAADRYTYLACLPWALLAGASLYHCAERAPRSPLLPVVLACAVLVTFGSLSWRQSRVWQDSGTLWRHALVIDPGSNIAHNNFANYFQDRGKLEEAKEHYLRAIEIKPGYAEAHINLGMVLGRQGDIDASTKQFQVGLRLDPENWKGRYYLGVNFAIRGDWQRADDEFRKSIVIAPDRVTVRADLAKVLARQGRVDEAIQELRKAIRIDPGFSDGHRFLAELQRLQKLDAQRCQLR